MIVFIIPVMILCFIFAIAMLIHVKRTWNNEDKSGIKKFNEIIHVTLSFGMGVAYPLFLLKFSANLPGVIYPTALEEMVFLGFLGIIGVMSTMLCWAISAKIQTLKHPERLDNVNNYDVFCEKFKKEYEVTLKRKITHLLPIIVVMIIIIIFYLLRTTPMFSDHPDKWKNYALIFIVILGLDFALTFLLGDLIRLFNYAYMPLVVGEMFAKGLTPKELDSFASTSVMVFGFGGFLLSVFPMFFILMLLTSVADGMASIFGIYAARKNRKHVFPKGTDKSIEGYIGGSLFTFLCVIFGVAFSNLIGFSSWSVWNFNVIIGLAILLSIVVFIIDLFTSKVKLQDNYLNPFVCAVIIAIYLAILGIPSM